MQTARFGLCRNHSHSTDSSARKQRQKLEAISPSHDTRDLTILFTDLVGFTALRTNVGEQSGLEILGAHQTIVRSLLAGYPDAQEIKTMGDAFLLAFARPSDGVAFCLRLLAAQRVARSANVPDLPGLRIGIHSGEVAILEGTDGVGEVDIFGLQVDVTKRVQDLATGNQILMTAFVFDNARTRIRSQELNGVGDIRWERHGYHRLKGLDNPIEICEVGEIEHGPFTAPAGATHVDRVESDNIEGWRPGLGVGVPATNWLLENRLGVGGFGEVWLAHDRTHTARRTVFKFCTRRSKVKSLQRELSVFNALTEDSGRTPPGIVEVRGTHDTEAPYYIELEYLAGGDLRRWIETHGRTATLRTKLSLASQMARSIALVHRSSFVHRDVKPSNFLLEQTEDPARTPALKLSDFGIGQAVIEDLIEEARATMALHSATLSRAAGTYLYIAPELVRPSSTEPSSGEVRAHIQKRAQPSADVYGLGVALYQLFAGSIDAIPGPGLRAVEDPVLREDITVCLDENPDQRPTAEELTDRLARYDERLKVTIEEERSRLEQERQQAMALAAALEAKRKAGHRTLIAVSMALVVAIILGALSMTQRQAAVSARDEALKATAQAESARNEALMATARAESARNDAEALVDFMLTDLNEKLEPIARLEILGSVANRVLSYYDKIYAENQSANAVRNRIHALVNVGNFLLNFSDRDKAVSRIEEAVHIASQRLEQEPDNPMWIEALADALEAKGGTFVYRHDVIITLERAVDLRKRLAELNPDDTTLKNDLVNTRRRLTYELRETGQREKALEVANEALAIAEDLYQRDPKNAKWLNSLSIMKSYVATLLPPEERAVLAGEALSLSQKLVELEPYDVNYRSSLGWRHFFFCEYVEGPDTLEHARTAVDIFRELKEQDPLNLTWQSAYVTTANKYGEVLNEAGYYESAAAALSDALSGSVRIAELHPEMVGNLFHIDEGLKHLTTALHQLGRHEEEMEVVSQNIKLFENGVANEFSFDVVWWLSNAYWRLQKAFCCLGEDEKAEKYYLASVDTFERLIEMAPERTDLFPYLATRQIQMVEYLLSIDKREEASKVLQALSETQARMGDYTGEDPVQINSYTWGIVEMGRAQRGLGDEEGAHESWKQAVKIIEPVTQVADPVTVNVNILDTHAQALLLLGRVEEARPMVDMLLERGWNNSEFLALCRQHGLLPASASPGDATQ